jgi:Virulence-associated protein E
MNFIHCNTFLVAQQVSVYWFRIDYRIYKTDDDRLIQVNRENDVVNEFNGVTNTLYTLSERSSDGVLYYHNHPQGWIRKENFKETDTIFIELDSGSIEEQQSILNRFELLSGLRWHSLTFSGSRSIHAHLKLNEWVDLPTQEYLSRLLCLLLGSDPEAIGITNGSRLPGMVRPSKNALQRLLDLSAERYDLSEILSGIGLYCAVTGLQFQSAIGDPFWKYLISKRKKYTPVDFFELLRYSFNDVGNEEFCRAWENSQKEMSNERTRRVRPGGTDVDKRCDRATIDDFNLREHHWQRRYWENDHWDGNCTLHDSSSGRSAWVARNEETGQLCFHCPVCTENSPRNLWQYFVGANLEDWMGSLGSNHKETKRMMNAFLGSNPTGENYMTNLKMTPVELIERFKSLVGDRLAMNLDTREMFFDGKEIDLGNAYYRLVNALGVDYLPSFTQQFLEKCVPVMAQDNGFSPMNDVIEQAKQLGSVDLDLLERPAYHFMGLDDAVSNKLLRTFLLAFVKVITCPGAKNDLMLILTGSQRRGKSSFARALGHNDWFVDTTYEGTDKDEMLKYVGKFVVEWSEIHALRRKEASDIKGFIARQNDLVRPPYGTKTLTIPRRFVLIGTTNESTFFNDLTGNRRFIVINTRKNFVNHHMVGDRWNDIVKTGLHLLELEEPWQLEGDDVTEQEAINAQMIEEDPWVNAIRDYLKNQGEGLDRKNGYTTKEMLANAIGMDIERQTPGHSTRVARILKYYFDMDVISTEKKIKIYGFNTQ